LIRRTSYQGGVVPAVGLFLSSLCVIGLILLWLG